MNAFLKATEFVNIPYMVWDNKRNVLFWQLQLVERCQVDQNSPLMNHPYNLVKIIHNPPHPKKGTQKNPTFLRYALSGNSRVKSSLPAKTEPIYTKNKGCVAVCQVPSVDIFCWGGTIFSPCFASRVMFARVLKTVIFAVPFSASCQVAKLKHERFQWRFQKHHRVRYCKTSYYELFMELFLHKTG